jgi:hypothetical protein
MTGTDAYLGDPTIRVPDVWLYSGTGVVTHHNSADRPDTVDVRSLRDLVSIIATYAYFSASASERDVPWLASITLDRAYTDLQSAASAAISAFAAGNSAKASYGFRRVLYYSDRGEDALRSITRLLPAGRRNVLPRPITAASAAMRRFRDEQLARLKDAGITPLPLPSRGGDMNLVVRRKRIGTIPLDDLPKDQRGPYPSGAWDKLVTVALYWCDGKRTLAEVAQLTEMEMGRPITFDWPGYFRFLQKHGYVDFVR